MHSWVSSREARRGLILSRSVVSHRAIGLTGIKWRNRASRCANLEYPMPQRGMVSRILNRLTGINGAVNLGGSIHPE